jgi:hypothetical protein
MADIIKHKRSGDTGEEPTTGELAQGELAINYYDGALFVETDNGTTQAIRRFLAEPTSPTAGYVLQTNATSANSWVDKSFHCPRLPADGIDASTGSNARIYSMPLNANACAAGGTPTANRAFYNLFYIPHTVDIKTIASQTFGTTGGNVKFAVYKPDGTHGRPSTRLYASAAIATGGGFGYNAATGTPLVTLSPGLYWVAVIYSTATGSFGRISARASNPMGIFDTAANDCIFGLYADIGSHDLADPAPTTFRYNDGSTNQHVALISAY